MRELSDLEKQILNLRQNKGYTIQKITEELNIKQKLYKDTINRLTEEGLYDEDKTKEAMQKRHEKEYRKRQYEKNKNKPKLSTEESKYFKKCTDFLCFNYLDYRFTKHYDNSLTSRLNQLHKNYTFKLIYDTMLSQKSIFDYYNNKINFKDDYHRISYFMKIVENNIILERKKQDRYKDIHEGFNKKINDEEITYQLNKNIITKPSKKLDLSEFLD